MNAYTATQNADASWMASMLESLPPSNCAIIKLMVESFINGMNAKEQLAANGEPARIST